jgi:hypothetical protein
MRRGLRSFDVSLASVAFAFFNSLLVACQFQAAPSALRVLRIFWVLPRVPDTSRVDSTVVIFEMNCSLNAPQVAAYIDSGEALAKMLLSILLCISAVRKVVAQIRNFPISPKGIFPI